MTFLFREKYSNLNDTDKLYGFISTYDKASSIDKIKIDSGPRGFPLTTLYCANNFNSERDIRFDWILLQANRIFCPFLN